MVCVGSECVQSEGDDAAGWVDGGGSGRGVRVSVAARELGGR